MFCAWHVGEIENTAGGEAVERGPRTVSAWSLVLYSLQIQDFCVCVCFLSLKGPPNGISCKVPQNPNSLLVVFYMQPV